MVADGVLAVLRGFALAEAHVVGHDNTAVAGQARDQLAVEVAPGRLTVEAEERLGAAARLIDVVLAKAVAREVVRGEGPRAIECLVFADRSGASAALGAILARGR